MKKTKWFFICILLVIGVSLIIYFVIFHNGLSKYSNDWGNFGSYIGGVGNVVLSFALLWFTYKADKREENTKQREENNKQRENEMQLLKQIEIILVKTSEYENIITEIRCANIHERGTKEFSDKIEYQNKLNIELIASYEILKTLATKCGKELPTTDSLKYDVIREYATKLLNDFILNNKIKGSAK